MTQQTVAQLRKLRSKMANQIRRSGKDPMRLLDEVTYKLKGVEVTSTRLLKNQRSAEAVFNSDRLALTGQAKRLAFKKQWEKDHWLDRDDADPKEMYKGNDQTFSDIKLDVKKRYLRVV